MPAAEAAMLQVNLTRYASAYSGCGIRGQRGRNIKMSYRPNMKQFTSVYPQKEAFLKPILSNMSV